MNYQQKYEKYKTKYENALKQQNRQSSMNHLGGALNSDSSLEKILENFFEHQMSIKMLHFQTKSYGAHKSLDCYLCKFNSNFDRFMETAQGSRVKIIGSDEGLSTDGRLTNKDIAVNVTMLTDGNIDSHITSFKRVLNSQIPTTFGTHLGLLAIRDEMLADVDQLQYLLTFK